MMLADQAAACSRHSINWRYNSEGRKRDKSFQSEGGPLDIAYPEARARSQKFSRLLV
jgi:hypothetical protein